MKEFMMIFRNEKNENAEPPSQEQMQAVMKQWQTWIKSIAQKGHFSSTNRLLSEGKTLKSNQSVSDGPYAEVKEVVGGYLNVKADSLEQAIELAKGCPGLQMGSTVEVRAVMNIDANPDSRNFLDEVKLKELVS
ncbi:MAG: YciI family protein [Flavisolibacter sp.]|jgi:hypothetical protein